MKAVHYASRRPLDPVLAAKARTQHLDQADIYEGLLDKLPFEAARDLARQLDSLAARYRVNTDRL